jgi:hypothetical protein
MVLPGSYPVDSASCRPGGQYPVQGMYYLVRRSMLAKAGVHRCRCFGGLQGVWGWSEVPGTRKLGG